MTPVWHEQAARRGEESHKHQEQEPKEQEQEQQHSPIQRVDTPCPAALRRQQQHLQADSRTRSLSFVLLPDGSEPGTRRRFIPLDAGQTTVVSKREDTEGGAGFGG